MAAGVGGIACALLVGGVVGVFVGAGLAIALDRGLRRLEPRSVRRRRELLAADLPMAADLLAACLLAGAPLDRAADAVSDVLDGPLAEELADATARIRLGAEPAAVWRSLAFVPAMAPLGRALARAADSGAPLADALVRLADEQRSARRRAAFVAAQKVGVWAAAPLGLCFLPAFVLLGVVPLIVGIAQHIIAPR
ncbi:MAG: type II secretion protein F [Streptosporangiales bacterium]|nr:type II secretion protein F [Streptosporangiales bacterium]